MASQPSHSGSTCERCDGSGKLRYDNDILAPDGSVVGHESGTRACPCVRDLPPIEGAATWWDLETLFSTHFPIPIGNETMTVEVSGEVPRGEDGRRRYRTLENSYYPVLVEVECPARLTLHADTARELGELLIRVAEVCEEADRPVEVGS